MSSGVADKDQVAALRAMAHPVRLRVLSLLTGSAMSAAEVARELELTHANASYHLRLLRDVGLLVDAGEESIRGGKAQRYRYDLDHPGSSSPDAAANALYYQAIAGELVRRASSRTTTGARGASSDAELWVSRDAWGEAVDRVADAMHGLHRAAVAPHTSGTVHVSVTAA
ncbi:MAG: ArsR/SmtB family transcription factor, partial [Actinomycetes bacterium]